jgi:Protein of unknown function (DUF4232)
MRKRCSPASEDTTSNTRTRPVVDAERWSYVGPMRWNLRRLPALLALALVIAPVSVVFTLDRSSASAASAVAECSDVHLNVAVTGTQGATGTGVENVIIVNLGERCFLFGYPTVRLLGAGRQFTGRLVHDTDSSNRPLRPKRVVLVANGTASFTVSFSDFAVGNAANCTLRWINVIIPPVTTVSTVFHLPQDISLCHTSNAVGITPIEAGAQLHAL